MDIHGQTFEKLLEIASSLEEQSDIEKMIEALARLEKNIAYMRKRLVGKLNQVDQTAVAEELEKRRKLKASLQVLTRDRKPDSDET